MTSEGNALAGITDLVAGDPYDVYLTEPVGFTFTGGRAVGAEVLADGKVGDLRVLGLWSARGVLATWRLEYATPGP